MSFDLLLCISGPKKGLYRPLHLSAKLAAILDDPFANLSAVAGMKFRKFSWYSRDFKMAGNTMFTTKPCDLVRHIELNDL